MSQFVFKTIEYISFAMVMDMTCQKKKHKILRHICMFFHEANYVDWISYTFQVYSAWVTQYKAKILSTKVHYLNHNLQK